LTLIKEGIRGMKMRTRRPGGTGRPPDQGRGLPILPGNRQEG
jgi:hypothetical protein